MQLQDNNNEIECMNMSIHVHINCFLTVLSYINVYTHEGIALPPKASLIMSIQQFLQHSLKVIAVFFQERSRC